MITADATAYLPLNVQLQPLCRQRRTGTLIGVTEQGDSLLVALQDGSIVGLSSKNVFGAAALARLQGAVGCKSSFKDQLLMRTDADLPASDTVLQRLGVEPDAAAPVGAGSAAANGALVNAVKEEASELFGPAAVVFVDDLLAGRPLSNAEQLRERLRELADVIGEPSLTGELITRVIKKAGLKRRGEGRS